MRLNDGRLLSLITTCSFLTRKASSNRRRQKSHGPSSSNLCRHSPCNTFFLRQLHLQLSLSFSQLLVQRIAIKAYTPRGLPLSISQLWEKVPGHAGSASTRKRAAIEAVFAAHRSMHLHPLLRLLSPLALSSCFPLLLSVAPYQSTRI